MLFARVALTSTLLLLALAPAAQATTRYADAAGSGSQPCSAAAPCSLKDAVQAAQSGDDIVVAPGDYSVTTPLKPRTGVAISGAADRPRPRLVGASNLGAAVLTLQSATANHLYVEGGERGHPALSMRATAVGDVIAVGEGSGAGALVLADHDGTVLTGSVVRCDGCDDGALIFKDGEGNGSAAAVNVTALADGAAPAIDVQSSSAALSIVNVIAAGGTTDIAGGSAPLEASFSAFRPAASTGVTDGGGNVAAAPLFADGDGREAAGSPTIDAGTVDPRAGVADPDGRQRPTGARTDIGAFEAPAGALGAPTTGAKGSTGGSAATGSTAFGTTIGPDLDGGADGLAPVGKPVAGHSVAVGTASGKVLVRLTDSGRFFPLGAARQLPLGAEIDARAGTVRLTSAADSHNTPQTGLFTGSRFRVRQTKSAKPLTQLELTGGSFAACGRRARAAKAGGKSGGARRLWGRDKGGRFQTRGRTAAATVRGTRWLTEDTCQGTRVQVAEGSVTVHDAIRHQDVVVRAGRSYLARR